jgi:hypothetical protein
MSTGECDLCANPYPYMCGGCADVEDIPVARSAVAPIARVTANPAVNVKAVAAVTNRIWIGSGEDLPPQFVV